MHETLVFIWLLVLFANSHERWFWLRFFAADNAASGDWCIVA
jgi:hypothetical protein